MLKKFFNKYRKNPVAEKDKEIVSELVEEGKEHLSELKKIDQEILTLQRSTKTTFSFFAPIHNYCRTKYAWYYNWHIKPYATKVHAGILMVLLTTALVTSYLGIFGGHIQQAKAASLVCMWTGEADDGGNWSTPGNWGGTGCDGLTNYPSDTETNKYTVLVTNGSVGDSIVVDAPITISEILVDTFDQILIINNPLTLDKSAGGTGNLSGVSGAGTIQVNSTLHVEGDYTLTTDGNVSVAAVGILDIDGNYTGVGEAGGFVTFEEGANAFFGGDYSEPGWGTNNFSQDATFTFDKNGAQNILSMDGAINGNLIITGSGTKTFDTGPGSGSCGILNNLTIVSGTFDYGLVSGNSQMLCLSGNIDIQQSGAVVSGNRGIVMWGSTISDNSLSGPQDLGRVELYANNTLLSSMKAKTVTVASGTTLSLGAGNTLELAGDGVSADALTLTGTGTIDAGTSTVKYSAVHDDGSVNVTNAGYYSLELAGAENYLLGKSYIGAAKFGGGIKIDSGAALNSNGHDVEVSGDWDNTGTFTQGTKTVTFSGTGTSTIKGTTTFNNLTFDSTAGAKIVKTTAGTTQTVGGALSLSGSLGKLITYQSTTDGGGAGDRYTYAIPSNITDVNYANVRDFVVSGGTIAPVIATCTDNGNNANWLFNFAPSTPTSLIQAKTDDTSITTGSWINETSAKLSASISDTDASDQVKLQVEVQPIGTSFTGTPSGTSTSYCSATCTNSVTISGLVSGTQYHWQARSIDDSSATSNWASYGGNDEGLGDFKIDTTAPIAFTPVATPATWTNSDVSLAFSTTDASSGVASYQVKIDSGSYSTQTSPYTIVVSGLSDGAHTATVKAIDAVGNYREAVATDFQVDKTAPTGGAISIDEGSYTTDTSVSLTLSASDATSGMYQIGISENDTDYTWSAYATSKSYTITGSQGLITIYVKFKDTAGNISGVATDTIRYDPTPPSTPGQPSATTPTNIVRPAWGWSASTDTNSGINKYEVQLDSGSWIDIGNTTSWTTSSDLSAGTHTLKTRSTDNAGNLSFESVAGSVLVDLTAPTISAFTINNNDATATSTSVTLQITTSDASAGLAGRKFSQDGVTYSDWESCDNTTCNLAKSYTLNDGDGTKTVHIKTKDAAGNESNASSDTILLDTTGPGAFSLYSPANNSWTNSTSVHLTWESAVDLASGLQKYQLYLDDAIINSNIASNTTSYDLSDLPIGTHTWQIKAVDNLNNETLSEKRTFGIDQIAPSVPTALTVTNLSNTDLKLVKDLPVKIGWTRSEDAGAGVLSYLVYIGSTPGTSDIINGEEVGVPNYDANLQTDGVYYVRVKAKGNAANISALSEEYSFKVDHTAPSTIAKTVSFDISNRIAGTYSAYIVWSSSVDSSSDGIKEYVIYQGNEKIGSVPLNSSGKESPRRFIKTDLKPGSYSFKVAAVDMAENLGAFSSESLVEISAEKGPALSITDLKATPSTLVDPESGKTSMLVSWKTSTLATSVVEMEGKSYGEEDLTKLNTGHSILITDLMASTTYRFSAKSRDIFGNQATSEGASARTGAKVEKQSTLEIILNSLRDIFSVFKRASAAALEKIGLIKPTQITKEGLIVYNVSDPDIGNAVVISLIKGGQSIEKSADGKSFSSLATPTENYYIDDQVSADKTYYYRQGSEAGIARVNLGGKQDEAPIISDSKVVEEATQLADDKVRIAVGWQTDIPSTSQISYGIGDTNMESTKDDNLNTNHFVIIEGLKSGTEYKFKAKSADENGLGSESEQFAFSTPKTTESQSIINIIIKQLQNILSKLVSWMRI